MQLGSDPESDPGLTPDPGSDPSHFERSTIQRPMPSRRASARFAAASTLSARARQSRGHAARRLEPVELRVGGLAGGRILPGGLPEIRRRALDVENVVDDLKRQAELARGAIDRVHLLRRHRRP